MKNGLERGCDLLKKEWLLTQIVSGELELYSAVIYFGHAHSYLLRLYGKKQCFTGGPLAKLTHETVVHDKTLSKCVSVLTFVFSALPTADL